MIVSPKKLSVKSRVRRKPRMVKKLPVTETKKPLTPEPNQVTLTSYTVEVESRTVQLYDITATDREDLKAQLAQRLEDGTMDDVRIGDDHIKHVRVNHVSRVPKLPEPSQELVCQHRLPVIQM